MADGVEAFELEEDPKAAPVNLSEYAEKTLEERAGGSGRFQYLYLLLLGLPWSYSSLLAMVSIFAGKNRVAKEAIKLVNCSSAGESIVVPPANTSDGTPLPIEDSYVMEFGLFCARHELIPLLSTLYFFGFMVGVPIFGAISDRFGRRIAYIIPLVVMQISSILAAVAPSYKFYAAMRVMEGFGVAGFGLVAYVWCAEMLGPELRPALTWVPNVLWSIGQMLLSPLAFYLRPWRHLRWAVALLCLPFFAYFPFLIESPKWLASKGKAKEVWTVLSKIAKVNRRKPIPPIPFELAAAKLDEPGSSSSGSGSLLQLLDSRLLGRFLVMCLNWFTISLAYFGLSLNATSLPLTSYWANVVGALVAIPAYYLAAAMIELPGFGRRGAVCFGFLLGGICLVLSMVGGELWLTILYYVAMSAISLVFAVIYIYASELFPTDIRASSMGLQSLCARIGAMLAPFVGDLGDKNLTLLLFAAPCLTAGLATLILPETRGKPLPGTIDDLDIDESLSEDSASDDDTSQTTRSMHDNLRRAALMGLL